MAAFDDFEDFTVGARHAVLPPQRTHARTHAARVQCFFGDVVVDQAATDALARRATAMSPCDVVLQPEEEERMRGIAQKVLSRWTIASMVCMSVHPESR
jgi:hypothetical protein